MPIISDGSRCDAARTASRPMPGHENTCSVMIAPATSSGRMQADHGDDREQRVPQRVADQDRIQRRRPFACAVVTNSLLSTSSMPARV